MINCSVCIPTYKRPELLKKLLNSLAVQQLPSNLKLEIIVVDNDPDLSAEVVCKQFQKAGQLELHYFTQSIKNISLTRNVAIEHAIGEYILFIDDDEIACKEWVATLTKNIIKFEADVVFGRIVSYFSEDVPDWVKKCFIYNRLAPQTGTVAVITRTGNCIIKTAILKEIPTPFDPQYGNSGGEDTHLFEKLRQNGAKFVNCYEAWTAEFVPLERTTFSWLFMRALRTGNTYARRSIELAGKRKIIMRLHQTIIGFTNSIISLLLMIITFPSRVKRLHWALKTVANCGKILAVFGYFPKEYR